ncbi:unnamed protein product [Calypogeia fissa]
MQRLDVHATSLTRPDLKQAFFKALRKGSTDMLTYLTSPDLEQAFLKALGKGLKYIADQSSTAEKMLRGSPTRIQDYLLGAGLIRIRLSPVEERSLPAPRFLSPLDIGSANDLTRSCPSDGVTQQLLMVSQKFDSTQKEALP